MVMTNALMDETPPAAGRPLTLEQTGLPESLLLDLLLKQLARIGVADLSVVCAAMGLAGGVVEPLVAQLRREALVETRGASGPVWAVRYALTDRGRASAAVAHQRCGYVGPAPIPGDEYDALVRAQSLTRRAVTPATLRSALTDVVVSDETLDRIGPALHSGRALFLYGAAGAGKSFLARRLANVFDDPVQVPYAVWAGGVVVRVFDPANHRRVETDGASLRAGAGADPRLALCRRPLVVAGGELTLDLLDLRREPATNQHVGPLQMRANNGLLLLDDMGRQRVPPEAILNRWIVPMEERRDYLHTESGAHFSLPFDVVLVFSGNRDPRALGDEAFLRRIGYKVRLDALTRAEYAAVWRQVCAAQGIPYEPHLARFVAERLHARDGVPLLGCYPRDLIGLVLDGCRYRGEPYALDEDRLQRAWKSFIVRDDTEVLA